NRLGLRMKNRDIFPAWGRILSGRRPFLSLEITKECPLACPGCYAYSPEHLGNGTLLRQLSDLRGKELVSRALSIIETLRPLHVSIVGGEPLVRYRELDEILTAVAGTKIEVQLVTSAVRPIPPNWAKFDDLHLVVSIDGLQPEHDKRRAPATYERILRHIAGHSLIVHCTITRQMIRPGYLREFCEFWSARKEVRKIWFTLYTPQEGETSAERLTHTDRHAALGELLSIRVLFPKVHMPDVVLNGYTHPPQSPEECIFSQITTCISADLVSRIEPCQFGGRPVCSECGCIASAGLASVGRHRVTGLVPVSSLFKLSQTIGQWRA